MMSLVVLASLAVGVEAADEERWIVSYRVADLTSKQLVLEMDFEEESYIQNTQIFAGEEYNITIVLDIGLTARAQPEQPHKSSRLGTPSVLTPSD